MTSISAASVPPRPADASTTSRSIRRIPPCCMSARPTGGIWKSTNNGVTWKDVFGQQPDNAFGALAIFSGDTKHHLGGHRGAEQPSELVVGRRRVSIDRRRRFVDLSRPARDALHRPRRPAPDRSQRRVRRRRREPVGGQSGARRLQDDRRRADVEQGALRRSVHRRDRHRDGSARSECAVRGDLPAPAQGLRLQRRRPGQRDLQDDRRRRDVAEARERHPHRRQGPYRPGHRGVETRRARGDHRARDRRAARTAPRTPARRGRG